MTPEEMANLNNKLAVIHAYLSEYEPNTPLDGDEHDAWKDSFVSVREAVGIVKKAQIREQ